VFNKVIFFFAEVLYLVISHMIPLAFFAGGRISFRITRHLSFESQVGRFARIPQKLS
jgi:hypothetical protein